MTAIDIPFCRASIVGRELDYIAQAVSTGHVSGDQAFGRRCEALLREAVGAARVLMTTSCTHALEMAALLLRVGPGDEVALPSFTFVSTANAFALRGARPVFVDVRPDTLGIDPDDLERKLTARTRAIVVVHYAGVACAIDRVLEIGRRHGIPVVEDNAHGLFGAWRGRPLGSFGALATLSFHETKNFTCGEGGALVVNDPALVERAEIVREKGTDRSRFFRGQVDKYTWVDLGSSYVLSDVLAAFLLGQLEERGAVQARRRAIWERYDQELAGWCRENGVTRPTVPDGAGPTHHIFYLLLPSLAARTSLVEALRGEGILAVFHYQALHLSEMGRSYGGRPGDCPVAEDLADRLLRLPLFFSLSDADQDRVIRAVAGHRVAP